MTADPPPQGTGAPRWFLALPLLAIAAWWPWSPYWQSDDFIAVSTSRDFQRVLSDFVGPQYGATDLWLFYRPLITFSFWLEQQFGGPSPMLSHVSNVLAHAASTLLVGLLWRRLLGDRGGFCAGLVWSLMPGHVGSIVWAVGRVDCHTTAWCLLAVWLVLRADERRAADARATAWPAALATSLALLSKELAVVVPPLATLVVFVRAAGPFAPRLRAAVAGARGPWLVLAAYVPWRWIVIGGIGGYEGTSYDPVLMVTGAARAMADLAAPLRWVGLDGVPSSLPAWLWLGAAALPPIIAVLLALRRAPRTVLGAAAAFAIATLPIAAFFSAAGNPQSLRLYYLPTIALAGVVAAAGRGPTIAVLLASAWPFVAARAEWYRADQQTQALHRTLLATAAGGAAHPMFVDGLPQTSPSGIVVQMLFGIDRLLLPPFGDGRATVCALRPMSPAHDAFRLYPLRTRPFELPTGSTWFFDGSELRAAPPPPPLPLPELVVGGDEGGVLDLTTPRLDVLAADPEATTGLQLRGVRAPCFRLTLFTASGYFATLCEDHAPAGASDGEIRLRRWFSGGAPYSPGALIGDVLAVPTSLDLVPEFPVLIEAGAVQGTEFVPTHRARRLLTFRFDREYPNWVRRVQGRGR